jgi:hypothetical protein
MFLPRLVIGQTMYNFNPKSLVGLALNLPLVLGSAEKRDFDVFDYVDPLIGTINGGKLSSSKSEISLN